MARRCAGIVVGMKSAVLIVREIERGSGHGGTVSLQRRNAVGLFVSLLVASPTPCHSRSLKSCEGEAHASSPKVATEFIPRASPHLRRKSVGNSAVGHSIALLHRGTVLLILTPGCSTAFTSWHHGLRVGPMCAETLHADSQKPSASKRRAKGFASRRARRFDIWCFSSSPYSLCFPHPSDCRP